MRQLKLVDNKQQAPLTGIHELDETPAIVVVESGLINESLVEELLKELKPFANISFVEFLPFGTVFRVVLEAEPARKRVNRDISTKTASRRTRLTLTGARNVQHQQHYLSSAQKSRNDDESGNVSQSGKLSEGRGNASIIRREPRHIAPLAGRYSTRFSSKCAGRRHYNAEGIVRLKKDEELGGKRKEAKMGARCTVRENG
jgi:hypothetical protein